MNPLIHCDQCGKSEKEVDVELKGEMYLCVKCQEEILNYQENEITRYEALQDTYSKI